jgi:oligosaccharide repeat unit polymerase
MLVLYEANLLSYIPLTSETWLVVSLAYFSYCLGILVYFIARKSLDGSFNPMEFYGHNNRDLFGDKEKIFILIIYLLGFLGLIATLQHWYILLKLFGSVPAVLINANVLYRLRVGGEIKGMVPFIATFNNVALFFAAVYTGYKRKITITSFFPFIGVILNDVAQVGRAGIYVAFLEFFTTYFVVSFLFSKEPKGKKSRSNIVGFIIVFLIIMGSLNLVRSVRGQLENYVQTSSKLKELKTTQIITPSIYLYFSAHVGVLSRYLTIGKEETNTSFGANSFLVIYSVLSKFGMMKRPSDYQQGYYIPMWTNTGTYLREIDADFGSSGIFIIPFLLGFGVTFYWFKFFSEKRFVHLILLANFFIIIEFSYVVMATRLASMIIKLVILLILAPLIERYPKRTKEDIAD